VVVGIPDIITCANFGEDRLRGLGVAGGQSLPFSIDFDRRPYNTLTLPCECVIMMLVACWLATVCVCVCDCVFRQGSSKRDEILRIVQRLPRANYNNLRWAVCITTCTAVSVSGEPVLQCACVVTAEYVADNNCL